VDYITKLVECWNDEDRRNRLLRLYFAKLQEYADFVNSKNVKMSSFEGVMSIDVAEKLARFTIECPEGGTMPQFIVGNLIRLLRKYDNRYNSVGGVDESVFGTNTTSKKPGDFWEILSDGNYGVLYEVTVKIIDEKRLDDCAESLFDLALSSRQITFICNLPHDTAPLGNIGSSLEHRGVGFQFIDIRSFILSVFVLLTDEQQREMIILLQEFIYDSNRQVKTKEYWARHFAA